MVTSPTSWQIFLGLAEEIGEPEIFLVSIKENEPSFYLLFQKVAFVAQQARQKIIFAGVEGFQVGNLVDDLIVHVR